MDAVIILLSWILFAAVGWAIGRGRGFGDEGLLWGAFLGPIGWLILLNSTPIDGPPKRK